MTATKRKNLGLILEQLLLYVGIPLLLFIYVEDLRTLAQGGSFLIVILPVFAFVLLIWMLINKTFYNVRFVYTKNFWQHFKSILVFFIPSTLFWTVLFFFLEPTELFYLPKEKTRLWVLIMLGYPLLSVLPQGIVFRVFFFHRYRTLYQKPVSLIIASGLLFCYAHIMFHNIFAIIFTLLGGFLFAYRYHQSKSWLISSLEHAMYGNMLFTIGFGQYLVAGV